MLCLAEYIWLDGTKPTQQLRSKARIVPIDGEVKIADFPEWGFDGSSTGQATGNDSDCVLKPVSFIKDPIRGEGNFLVLCEVYDVNDNPHETNTRALLRETMDAGGAAHEPWIGFEQEYTLFNGDRPYMWPTQGYPGPQGPYYCGVGTEKVYGRDLVEAHTRACMDAEIMIYGINAEVMPAQWEFQIGYRGLKTESADALNVADHLIFARWLLFRLGEEFDIQVSFSPKPVKGDWNGAGKHTNFSTKAMRDPKTGEKAIADAIECLKSAHNDHIVVYGDGLADRLTGAHETCHISEFRSGRSDRGASIRIPASVAKNGYGYIEDRRPAANADPYTVANRLISTICGIQLGAGMKKAANA